MKIPLTCPKRSLPVTVPLANSALKCPLESWNASLSFFRTEYFVFQKLLRYWKRKLKLLLNWSDVCSDRTFIAINIRPHTATNTGAWHSCSNIMVFFEGQHFSVSVSFLSFGGYIFGVYSSMGKQLGLSDNTGNFEFFWRSDMVEKLRKVMEQYHSKVFALLCHCALFSVDRFYGLVYIGRWCLRR